MDAFATLEPNLSHLQADPQRWEVAQRLREYDRQSRAAFEFSQLELQFGGSVIIETIFSWPGLGRLGYEAILNRDFPVILTLNFIAAILTLIGTFLSDILYAVADPRITLN